MMEENPKPAICTADGCGSDALPAVNIAAPPRAAMMGRLSVISDAICPWCYIGKRRLEKALALLGPSYAFEVRWHPFELNPDMPREGVERSLYRTRKFGSLEHSQRLDAQVAAAGAQEGLAFHYDRIRRTPNTRNAHRLVWFAPRIGASQDLLVDALFSAYFTQGRDIGDSAVLADIAAACGMDQARVQAFLAGEDGTRDIIAEEAAAQRAGVNGVPAFALDGRVLFTGAQPPEYIAEGLRAARAAATGA
jgi:predicted DsbA family dithiol-disulfide isomerase